MEKILHDLFSSAEMTPHGFCLLWRADLLGLHVFSDKLPILVRDKAAPPWG